jgi:hypothetical protein
MPQEPDPYVLGMLRILAAPLSEVPGVGLAIFLQLRFLSAESLVAPPIPIRRGRPPRARMRPWSGGVS